MEGANYYVMDWDEWKHWFVTTVISIFIFLTKLRHARYFFYCSSSILCVTYGPFQFHFVSLILHHMQECVEVADCMPHTKAKNFMSTPKKYLMSCLLPFIVMYFRSLASMMMSCKAS